MVSKTAITSTIALGLRPIWRPIDPAQKREYSKCNSAHYA